MTDLIQRIRETFDRGGYVGLKADDGTDVEAAVGILFGEIGDTREQLRTEGEAIDQIADEREAIAGQIRRLTDVLREVGSLANSHTLVKGREVDHAGFLHIGRITRQALAEGEGDG